MSVTPAWKPFGRAPGLNSRLATMNNSPARTTATRAIQRARGLRRMKLPRKRSNA